MGKSYIVLIHQMAQLEGRGVFCNKTHKTLSIEIDDAGELTRELTIHEILRSSEATRLLLDWIGPHPFDNQEFFRGQYGRWIW